MNFQVIRDEFYAGILSELASFVPEFKSVFENEDGIYPILGEFGRFLCNNITNDYIAKKGFNFINNSLTNGGSATEEAIVIQIFEQLYERNEFVKIARTYLDNNCLMLFDKFYK